MTVQLDHVAVNGEIDDPINVGGPQRSIEDEDVAACTGTQRVVAFSAIEPIEDGFVPRAILYYFLGTGRPNDVDLP
jgi:hypothetical protein